MTWSKCSALAPSQLLGVLSRRYLPGRSWWAIGTNPSQSKKQWHPWVTIGYTNIVKKERYNKQDVKVTIKVMIKCNLETSPPKKNKTLVLNSSAEWVSAAFSTTSGVPVDLGHRHHQASKSPTPTTNQPRDLCWPLEMSFWRSIKACSQKELHMKFLCGYLRPILFPTCMLLSLKPAAFNAARRSWSSSLGWLAKGQPTVQR